MLHSDWSDGLFIILEFIISSGSSFVIIFHLILEIKSLKEVHSCLFVLAVAFKHRSFVNGMKCHDMNNSDRR